MLSLKRLGAQFSAARQHHSLYRGLLPPHERAGGFSDADGEPFFAFPVGANNPGTSTAVAGGRKPKPNDEAAKLGVEGVPSAPRLEPNNVRGAGKMSRRCVLGAVNAVPNSPVRAVDNNKPADGPRVHLAEPVHAKPNLKRVPNALSVAKPVAQVLVAGARQIVQGPVLAQSVLRVLELNHPHSSSGVNPDPVDGRLHPKNGIVHNRLRARHRNTAPAKNARNNASERPSNPSLGKVPKSGVKPPPKNEPALRSGSAASGRGAHNSRRSVPHPAHQHIPEVRGKAGAVGRRPGNPGEQLAKLLLAGHGGVRVILAESIYVEGLGYKHYSKK